MNVFGIGLPEMALILVLALLVFGPKKLPEIGRSLGKAIKGFQDASREFEEEFKREADRIQKDVTAPMKASLEEPEKKALSPQTTGDGEAPEANSAPVESTSAPGDIQAAATSESDQG